METKDARKLTPEAQEALRMRVIDAVVNQGMRQVDACKTFNVGRTAVYNWLRVYEQGGHGGPEGEEARAQARLQPERPSGGYGGPAHHRPLPRPVEAAVRKALNFLHKVMHSKSALRACACSYAVLQ